MAKHLLLIILLLYVCSCTKKTPTQAVIELSVDKGIRLNDIIKVGNHFIICGGEKFARAKIYTLENEDVKEISLPINSSQKEINGLDISSEGNLIAVGNDAGVYQSADSGASWTFHQNNIWKEFLDIAFFTNDTALVVGKGTAKYGYISSIDKLGNGSNMVELERNFEIDKIDYVADGIGYCCGYGAIMKTTDFGKNWNYTSANSDFFKAMTWKNKDQGMAVGYEGSIIKTTDGGHQWTFIRNANNTFIKRLHFLDIASQGNTIVAVGEKGLIMVSDDDGKYWKTIEPFNTIDIRAVVIVDSNHFITVGEEGSILKITI